jgi:hypothetical protein
MASQRSRPGAAKERWHVVVHRVAKWIAKDGEINYFADLWCEWW